MFTSPIRPVSVAAASIAVSLLLVACGGGVSERTPLGGEGSPPTGSATPEPQESESPTATPSDTPTDETPPPDGVDGGGGEQIPSESDGPPPGVDFSLPPGPVALDGRNELADPSKVRIDPSLPTDINEDVVPLDGFDPGRWNDIPTDDSQSGNGLSNSGGGFVTDSPDQSAIPAE